MDYNYIQSRWECKCGFRTRDRLVAECHEPCINQGPKVKLKVSPPDGTENPEEQARVAASWARRYEGAP